jgi:hypothetical protein
MNFGGMIYRSGTGFWRKTDIEKFATTHCANSRQTSFFARKNAAANSVFLSKCTIASQISQ